MGKVYLVEGKAPQRWIIKRRHELNGAEGVSVQAEAYAGILKNYAYDDLHCLLCPRHPWAARDATKSPRKDGFRKPSDGWVRSMFSTPRHTGRYCPVLALTTLRPSAPPEAIGVAGDSRRA